MSLSSLYPNLPEVTKIARRFAKKTSSPAARKKVKIKVSEIETEKGKVFGCVLCETRTADERTFLARLLIARWEIWIILESSVKILEALTVCVEILVSFKKMNVIVQNLSGIKAIKI